jgi:hypothetical protein
VIQHVPGKRDISRLLDAFPSASVIKCSGDPMDTFCRAMRATDGGALFFEDDAILSSAIKDVDRYCDDHCTTLFRRDFRDPGVHWLPGSAWLFNVGFWCPAGMGGAVAEFAAIWPRREQHPTGFDLLIRDWLVLRRYRFRAVYPSMVQHAVGKSLLGPRAKDRRSPTWMP